MWKPDESLSYKITADCRRPGIINWVGDEKTLRYKYRMKIAFEKIKEKNEEQRIGHSTSSLFTIKINTNIKEIRVANADVLH